MSTVEAVGQHSNLGTDFDSREVDILPFDQERISVLRDGAIHIWHGRVDGVYGVYATRGGKSPDTHFVMK